MKMDPTTESIAHFIGIFDLVVEELRLRQEYLDFRLKRDAQEDYVPIEPISVKLLLPYQIGAYHPELAYSIGPVPAATRFDSASIYPQIEHQAAAGADRTADALEALPSGGGRIVVIEPPPEPFGFPLVAPGSIVAVTVQVAALADNDVFLSGLHTTFTHPSELQKTLDAMVAMADSLAAFDVPDLPADGDWVGLAKEALAQLDLAPATDGAAQIATLRGEEASGVFVNGAPVTEAPDWKDLLPAYLRPKDEETDNSADGEPGSPARDGAVGDGGSGRSAEPDFSRDFANVAPDPFKMDPGHQIVAGANKAINEIVLASSWVDAPVIVVLGDVVKFDAISQVNLLVEHDRIDGVDAGQASAGYNIAEIISESSKDPDAAPASDALPVAWQVVRIEADLIQVNWVKQFTYATDFDRAEVTFNASATFLGLGENQIVNSTILNELGYTYDLIFVAGNMVDASIVSQTNVLFDSDEVVTGMAGAVTPTAVSAPATGEATGGATGGATAAAAALTPEPPPAPPVEERTNQDDGIVATPAAVKAVNAANAGLAHEPGAGPAPLEGAAAEQQPVAPNPPSEPVLSLADNLLLNKATIKETGVDNFVAMKESFAAAARSLAEGAETIARDVAQDALFAGMEALRVLQVDGDLVKLNIFEQTNIIGDADQLRLDMMTLRDRIEAEMKLIAGSNALVNLATVAEYGVDSTVMAAGRVYDDAFIHQAELFDTDASPTGVAMAGLANDAIAAFLSDDILSGAKVTDHVAPATQYEGFAHLDVMQTALV